MRWKKIGLLYEPRPIHEKLATHASNPLAVHLRDDIFRIFFSGRDKENRSSVGFVDADVVRRELLHVHDVPAFLHGPAGSYFSHGVSIGNCYKTKAGRYILFMGWHVPRNGHWRGEIGRLILGDDLSLTLDGDRPFLGLSTEDPVSLSYPWVMANPKGGYDMWYGSTRAWDAGNGEMLHVIKHSHSPDGDHWTTSDDMVPYEIGSAQAFSRPTVARSPSDGYQMWFSYRGGTEKTYRIGYAESADGDRWTLALDRTGIDVSAEGWDSEMIEYPFVFDHKDQRYMLYNGNGYGRSGIGMAVLESE